MAKLIWLVPLLPLLGVIVNGLLLSWLPARTRRATAGPIATLMVVGAFAVAVLIATGLGGILNGQKFHDETAYHWITLAGSSLDIPMALRIDPLSVTMMLVVTGVGALIHLFSVGYMADDERVGRYFTYLNLFTFAMLILVLANNYVLMFVGWEGVGLCSYLLIGFWFERVSAAQAGKKAFLINRVGDVGFLLAMFLLFRHTGSLVFNTHDGTGALDKAHTLTTPLALGIPVVVVICLLFFLGCTGKSAQLPLYMWLPDAMEGPTPVSALIHAATMVTAGVYLVARSNALFSLSPYAQSWVAWIGIATALFAAIIAIKQYDIKRVLAYSTVSQLGYMFVGVGVGAYAAGITHLVTHAFFKALMFLGAGAVMHALEGQLDMRKMGNVKKYMPVTYATFALGWLAICGIPPFAGFWSKDLVLESAKHHGYEAIFWIGVLVAGMTAFYMTRMFVTVFHGSERIELGDEGHGGDAQEHGHSHDHGHAHDHGHSHGHDAHAAHGRPHVHPEQMVMNLPLIVLAILSVVGGILVVWGLGPIPSLPQFLASVAPDAGAHAAAGAEVAAHAAEGAAHQIERFNPFSVESIISVVAGVFGIAIAWGMYGPEKFARGWSSSGERALGALQDAYEGFWHGVVVRGGTALSNGLYAFVDRVLIDGAVNGAGWLVNVFAESLRTLQTGYVRNYALVMLAGAVFVVACFMVILQMQIPMGTLLPILGGLFAVAFLVSIFYGFAAKPPEGSETPVDAASHGTH
jgi:NADH-quinone oxidoreductase subunit L